MTNEIGLALAQRFGAAPEAQADAPDAWRNLAARGSCRAFRPEPVAAETIATLCALALCAPSKSDLQQRDIVVIADPALRAQLDALLCGGPLAQAWIAEAPHLLVFCGNNRRQRLLHEWRGRTFANDHLDAFFNAALDAGIALAQFVTAAEAAGLGCCPISAIRNHAAAVSALLHLPDHVFPVAGLALGWPRAAPPVSLRLPLAVTVHTDRYREEGLRDAVEAYDAQRAAAQPYAAQRYTADFGVAQRYGWSEDKARQYAKPERETFGAFVRAKGFRLE
jgi:nitroreductase/FMN reductase [NAD(P)H]